MSESITTSGSIPQYGNSNMEEREDEVNLVECEYHKRKLSAAEMKQFAVGAIVKFKGDPQRYRVEKDGRLCVYDGKFDGRVKTNVTIVEGGKKYFIDKHGTRRKVV